MNTYSLINTVAASAGDISLTARHLNVTTGYGSFPEMEYEKIKAFRVMPSLTEILSVYKFSYTANNNTEYSCTITQSINGIPKSFTAHIRDSGAVASNQTIGQALVAQFNGSGLQVTASWTNPNAFIDVIAKTGYPLFVGSSGLNVTAAANQTALIGVSTVGGTPDVFTKASHGLAVGDTIVVTAFTTDPTENGTWRVRAVPTINTFHVENANGNVLNVAGHAADAGGVVTDKAQEARGQGASMTGISGATSGETYHQYQFVFDVDIPGTAGGDSKQSGNVHDLYVKDTTTTAVPTNFVNFTAKMKGRLSGDDGTGVVPPDVVGRVKVN